MAIIIGSDAIDALYLGSAAADKAYLGTDELWPSASGNDEYTKLLLHFGGADASTSFVDSSASAHSLTAAGNAQIDTAQSKFGGSSLLLDGSGDYIFAADSADWDLTDDFTVDLWVRFASTGVTQALVSNYQNSAAGWSLQYRNTGALNFSMGDASIISRSWSPSTGIWYHLAVTRSSGVVRLFVDGAQLGSDASSSTSFSGSAASLVVGALPVGAQYVNGWLDEVRISKGIARWTANFTPPTKAYS